MEGKDFFARRTISDIIRGAIVRASEASRLVDLELPSGPEDESVDPFEITWVDLRSHPRTKDRGKPKGSRGWGDITGICLHQPAVWITDPLRTINWPVHRAIVPGPHENAAIIVLLQDPTAYMHHGHVFNRRDIGYEVVARACGIEGDPRTLWLPSKYKGVQGEERLAMAREATPGQLEATRRCMSFDKDLVAENGGALGFVHAHRQGHKSRVSDPGSRIWGACGEWATHNLGLSSGPGGWKAGSGHALPDAWTGVANGIRYNWRVDGRIEKDT